MRPLLISMSLLATSFSFSQNFYVISFEGAGLNENSGQHELYIDTASNPSNIWQIGPPQKNVFTSAYTLPNAMVTDTINPYPINDTSAFIVFHKKDWGAEVFLGGYYFVNADTLTDFGTIEISQDNGASWVDIINDTTYNNEIIWNSPKPTLTGNSNGWKYFHVDLTAFWPSLMTDTVQFRFSFISDGIQTNKDGLMYDSLAFYDVPPIGIDEIPLEPISIQVYPNPVRSTINIKGRARYRKVYILSSNGETLYMYPNSAGIIDVTKLNPGFYFVKIEVEDRSFVHKFVKY